MSNNLDFSLLFFSSFYANDANFESDSSRSFYTSILSTVRLLFLDNNSAGDI